MKTTRKGWDLEQGRCRDRCPGSLPWQAEDWAKPGSPPHQCFCVPSTSTTEAVPLSLSGYFPKITPAPLNTRRALLLLCLSG